LVKLVSRNDKALLDVRNDLIHVAGAEQVIMDSLHNDMKELQKEIAAVHETAKTQADEMNKKGLEKRMSLADLREQKTAVRNVENVIQYNKINHLTGRTSMERFTLNAAASINDAMKLTEDVKEKFTKLLEYFGEDDKMASNDFFGVIKSFMLEFGKAVEHVEKEDQQTVSGDTFSTNTTYARLTRVTSSSKRRRNVEQQKASVCRQRKRSRAGCLTRALWETPLLKLLRRQAMPVGPSQTLRTIS
jgi:hypothetical protein